MDIGLVCSSFEALTWLRSTSMDRRPATRLSSRKRRRRYTASSSIQLTTCGRADAKPTLGSAGVAVLVSSETRDSRGVFLSSIETHGRVSDFVWQVLKSFSDRALFLCYPDDFELSEESMALNSLLNYTGEIVIHVGETFPNTHCLPGAW